MNFLSRLLQKLSGLWALSSLLLILLGTTGCFGFGFDRSNITPTGMFAGLDSLNDLLLFMGAIGLCLSIGAYFYVKDVPLVHVIAGAALLTFGSMIGLALFLTVIKPFIIYICIAIILAGAFGVFVWLKKHHINSISDLWNDDEVKDEVQKAVTIATQEAQKQIDSLQKRLSNH